MEKRYLCNVKCGLCLVGVLAGEGSVGGLRTQPPGNHALVAASDLASQKILRSHLAV